MYIILIFCAIYIYIYIYIYICIYYITLLFKRGFENQFKLLVYQYISISVYQFEFKICMHRRKIFLLPKYLLFLYISY